MIRPRLLITLLSPLLLSGCLATPERPLSAHEAAARQVVPLTGDFDGDGVADYAFWNRETGRWFLMTSSRQPPHRRLVRQGAGYQVWWGGQGDEPLVGDFDGDGIDDLAVWRESISAIYLLTSTGGYNRASVRHFDGFAIKVELPTTP